MTTYSWDAADRLSAVAIDSDVDGHAEFTAAHTYDATGQRRSSVVTSGSVTTTTTFTYDGISLLGLASTTGTATTHLTYLRDELEHPRAVVVDAPELTSPVTLGLGTTMRGDVVSLTDGSGATLATWSYDPYGRPLSSTVTTTALLADHALASRIARLQVLRYAGYVYDEADGLYYLSQRYYDPGTCQFISRDPVGADGEESAYQYCGGDPVGATDPSGCATLDEAMASTVWGALSWTAKKYGTKYLSKDSAKLLKHYKKKYGAKGPKKATMADVKSPAPTIAEMRGALEGVSAGVAKTPPGGRTSGAALAAIAGYGLGAWAVCAIADGPFPFGEAVGIPVGIAAAAAAAARMASTPSGAAVTQELTDGDDLQAVTQVHHIVAVNARAAQPARDVLSYYGVGIQDPANQLALTANRNVPNILGTNVHSILHTPSAYYPYVNQQISFQTCSSASDVYNRLGSIAGQLSTGACPY